MKIAHSVFESVHSRPSFVYNRASLELLLALFFDDTFVVPTASVIDSPVLLTVFGGFLEAQEKYESQMQGMMPIEIRIDPTKHFDVSCNKHVLFDAAEAYLSGRAQTGRDLASEHPHNYPLPHNFAFISRDVLDKVGRSKILFDLRQHKLDLDNFSPYFKENVLQLNRYFLNRPNAVKPVGNLFEKGSYEGYVVPRLTQYTRELESYGIGSFHTAIENVLEETRRGGAFTRNQVNLRGENTLGEAWKKYFVPMVNHHYWDLLSRLFETENSINIEMGEQVEEDVARAIRSTVPGRFSLEGRQLRFAKRDEDAPEDGYESADRVTLQWDAIIRLRLSKECRARIKTLKEAETGKARIVAALKYADFISDNLKPFYKLEGDEYGRFLVELDHLEPKTRPQLAFFRSVFLPITFGYASGSAVDAGGLGGAVGATAGVFAAKFGEWITKHEHRVGWRSLVGRHVQTWL